MSKKFAYIFGLVLVIVALSAVPAAAQAEKGDKSVSFNGMVMVFTGEGVTYEMGVVTAGLSYYATEKVEVGVAPVITIVGGADTDTAATFGFTTFGRYNFAAKGRKAVPYLSAEYWLYDHHDVKNFSALRFAGGAKYYVKRNIAFDFNAGYARNFFADEAWRINVIDFRFGIAYVF